MLRSRLRIWPLPVAAALFLAACGDDTRTEEAALPDEPTSTTLAADDPESPYCRTALEWQVHELVPADETDPAAIEAYMGDYVEFAETAAAQAPPVIAEDWELSSTQIAEVLYPTMESFGFDPERAAAEATPEEMAAMNEPPPEVAAAQERIHAYESDVCAAGQPAPAEAEFAGSGGEAYCAAVAAFDEAVGEVAAGGFAAEDLEALAAGDAVALIEATAETAPPELADDATALVAYELDVRFPLFAAYDYDVARILREAPYDERRQFHYTDPAIVDAFARTLAYDEQVCGS